MFMFYFIIIFTVCMLIYYLVSTNLNPVPYFPTNSKDQNRVINALNLKNDQTVIDLGAGDGKIIFETAKAAHNKGLNTQFVAIDINFFLFLIMLFRRFFHPNKKNITIIWKDIFKYDFRQIIKKNKATTIYVYFAPWINDSVGSLIKKLPRPIKVISYYYPINNLLLTKKIKGEHNIYLYYIK